MKNLFSLYNLKLGLVIIAVFALYNYFVHGEIDWIEEIITTILAVVIMSIYDGIKK